VIDWLRHFVLIVEHGTFREAARHAHLSQPALTASIHRLESWAGARLLDRGRRGAAPTAAGTALLAHARAALAAVQDGRRAVAEIEGLHAGEVRIAASATACTYLLPPELAAFRRAHPSIRLLVRENTTGEALDALASGKVDVAIVTPRTRREARDGAAWLKDELVLVAAPGVDARTAPFVTFREGATSRALLDRSFPDRSIAMELGGISAILAHMRTGVGVALVSRAAVAADVAAGRLVVVADRRTPIARELRVFHRGADRLSPAARALVGRLTGGRPR
jgi:DNA-binding transcriptional LysR family regulator